jgi:hypothetical protein
MAASGSARRLQHLRLHRQRREAGIVEIPVPQRMQRADRAGMEIRVFREGDGQQHAPAGDTFRSSACRAASCGQPMVGWVLRREWQADTTRSSGLRMTCTPPTTRPARKG